jgi:hypothetical protein
MTADGSSMGVNCYKQHDLCKEIKADDVYAHTVKMLATGASRGRKLLAVAGCVFTALMQVGILVLI